jgi:ketosteroid isomerase-like protein
VSSTVDRLRAAYDAYNSGNIASVIDFAAEDIEVRPPPTSLEPDPFHGREALLRYLEPNMFEFQHAEPEEFLEEGERVFVAVRVRARGRGSGVELDDTAFHVWTLDGERAVRFEVFIDRDDALAALRS